MIPVKPLTRAIHDLFVVRAIFPGCLLWMVAWARGLGTTGSRKMGIRVTALWPNESTASMKIDEVCKAIELLVKHDPRRMRRVQRHIRVIFLGRITKGGAYLQVGRLCILNLDTIPADWSSSQRVIAIAGKLVHEATHGVIDQFGIPYFGKARVRIERICDQEEERAWKKIS